MQTQVGALEKVDGPGPFSWTGPIFPIKLLVGLLALLGRLGAATRGFRLGFLLRRVTLRFGLVLLRLALTGQVIATGHRAYGLLGPYP